MNEMEVGTTDALGKPQTNAILVLELIDTLMASVELA